MPQIQFQPMIHVDRGYYFFTVTQVYCHKPHRNICNGQNVKGGVIFSHILYAPSQAANLIRVVKHVLTSDCFSPYLELQNGVLHHTIMIYTTSRVAGPPTHLP